MKTIYLLLVGLSFFQLSFAQKNVKDSVMNSSKHELNYVIIEFDVKKHGWLFHNVTKTRFTKDEIFLAEKLLDRAAEEYNRLIVNSTNLKNTTEEKLQRIFINLDNYKRQYIPIINKKGEKEVWINCFRNAYDQDWKKEIISVRGGGDGFFNLKVNLAQNKCYDFRVNSPR